MTQQLINTQTGEFTLDRGFVATGRTCVPDLITHFGKEHLLVRDFKNGHSNYTIRNLMLGDLYFILTFYFFNEQLTKVDFVLQPRPYDEDAGWDSFDKEEEAKKGKFMEQWMAKQMQGDRKTYDWGKMGVSYDFQNLSSSCFVSYHSVSEMR